MASWAQQVHTSAPLPAAVTHLSAFFITMLRNPWAVAAAAGGGIWQPALGWLPMLLTLLCSCVLCQTGSFAGVSGIPHAFVVDAKGVIRHHGNSMEPRFDQVVQQVSCFLSACCGDPGLGLPVFVHGMLAC